jgi:hypothetical protein
LNKSKVSPKKILNLIPDKFKRFFFLGYFDADGCFYYNKKNYCRQLKIGSTYEQDWSCIEKLFKNLKINYQIEKRITKNKHCYSTIRTWGKQNVKSFGALLYQSFKKDKIGLKRKYEKFVLINNS